MPAVIEKNKTNSTRATSIRQKSKINLTIFNYCFLIYYYLIKEVEKNIKYATGVLLDVGCGSSPFEKYFTNHVTKYLKHEHPDSQINSVTYDYLSELPRINAPDNSVDTILSTSVLEHVIEPFETIKEFHRVLKTNGIAMIYVPQYWHLHEEPYDYHRFTKYLLKEKLKQFKFEIVEIKEIGKSFALCGQALCNALILLFDLKHIRNLMGNSPKKEFKNLVKSLIYTIYKSPLILLTITLIPLINIFFLILDSLFGSPRDTIGYFVIAKKRI